MATQDFLYGLAKFTFAGEDIGYIEESSFDLGGQEGESIEVNAAQVKGAPVLVIPKKNGTINPEFDLIQIDYKKLVKIMGGNVKGTEANPTGWEAPIDLTHVTGEAIIQTDSGHKITIPKCQMGAYPTDKLSLDGVAKIHCKLKPILKDKDTAPYSIEDVDDAEPVNGQGQPIAEDDE
jgi:hypothetical protein|nr:MAG TPA: hypothetical protein [Caudoviricetes sp.]